MVSQAHCPSCSALYSLSQTSLQVDPHPHHPSKPHSAKTADKCTLFFINPIPGFALPVSAVGYLTQLSHGLLLPISPHAAPSPLLSLHGCSSSPSTSAQRSRTPSIPRLWLKKSGSLLGMLSKLLALGGSVQIRKVSLELSEL